MKISISIFFFSLSLLANAQIENVCFSPSPCCQNNVITLLHDSQKTVDIAIYSLTDVLIKDAILEAANRGVKIRVIYDKSQSYGKGSQIDTLIHPNIITTSNTSKVKIEHNKYIIIDSQIVMTGSYNFTNNATLHNDENCVMIYDSKYIQKYIEHFNIRFILFTL